MLLSACFECDMSGVIPLTLYRSEFRYNTLRFVFCYRVYIVSKLSLYYCFRFDCKMIVSDEGSDDDVYVVLCSDLTIMNYTSFFSFRLLESN